jgi:hypothetical protein
MHLPPLPPEQEAEAQVIYLALQQPFLDQALVLARLLASKKDEHLLGKTEFEVRDVVHRLGAKVLETALLTRKKGATKAPV